MPTVVSPLMRPLPAVVAVVASVVSQPSGTIITLPGRTTDFVVGRGKREEGDRHPTRSAPRSNSEKQASQGWGATEGEAELKDEQAAEEIAQTEKKEAAEGEAAPEAEAKEEEPQEKVLTYDQYLAKLAEKKLALEQENALKVRKPNEGAEDKFKGLKPLTKNEDEALFAPTVQKKERQRERKTKQIIEIENRYVEERPRGGRGGRGARDGARGGRGRGGAPRGGRGGAKENAAPAINTNDETAFPSLGSR